MQMEMKQDQPTLTKSKVLVVAFAKEENQHINEFVDHYIEVLGVDRIMLFDNNNLDGEILTVDEKHAGQVIIMNARGQKRVMFNGFDYAYHWANINRYNWVLFCDCDEYIFLHHYTSLGELLSHPRYDGFNEVRINWLFMTDTGHVAKPYGKLNEVFNQPLINDDVNTHTKPIVRCRCMPIDKGGEVKFSPTDSGCTYKVGNYINNPHFAILEGKVCDLLGREIVENINPYNKDYFPTYQIGYMKHFMQKSCEEFTRKIKRGRPEVAEYHVPIDMIHDEFFMYNTRTKEKEEMIAKIYAELDLQNKCK